MLEPSTQQALLLAIPDNCLTNPIQKPGWSIITNQVIQTIAANLDICQMGCEMG